MATAEPTVDVASMQHFGRHGAKTLQRLPGIALKEVAKKSEVTAVAAGAVEGRILVIRDHQVMLDEDLAGLYGVERKL